MSQPRPSFERETSKEKPTEPAENGTERKVVSSVLGSRMMKEYSRTSDQ